MPCCSVLSCPVLLCAVLFCAVQEIPGTLGHVVQVFDDCARRLRSAPSGGGFWAKAAAAAFGPALFGYRDERLQEHLR